MDRTQPNHDTYLQLTEVRSDSVVHAAMCVGAWYVERVSTREDAVPFGGIFGRIHVCVHQTKSTRNARECGTISPDQTHTKYERHQSNDERELGPDSLQA